MDKRQLGPISLGVSQVLAQAWFKNVGRQDRFDGDVATNSEANAVRKLMSKAYLQILPSINTHLTLFLRAALRSTLR
jgi:hypothetical protein